MKAAIQERLYAFDKAQLVEKVKSSEAARVWRRSNSQE